MQTAISRAMPALGLRPVDLTISSRTLVALSRNLMSYQSFCMFTFDASVVRISGAICKTAALERIKHQFRTLAPVPHRGADAFVYFRVERSHFLNIRAVCARSLLSPGGQALQFRR